jgi:hypothetical protein
MPDRQPQTLSLNVMRVMANIRSSLDVANTTANVNVRPASHLQDAYLQFEAVRIRFRQNSRSSSLRSAANVYSRILTLQQDLATLTKDVKFASLTSTVQYRAMPPQQEEGWMLHPALETRGISVFEAVTLLLQSIGGVRNPSASANQAELFETVQQLDNILPASQGVAPLQFNIVGGRLSLKRQRATPANDDIANIEEAKSQLESDGNRILGFLDQSNCDRRIIESVQDLQNQLKSGKDIVRLGLTSIGCDILCDKMEQEIPDAVCALLKAHTVGLSMYVAQFPEWQRFSSQASQIALTEDDVDALKIASEAIIVKLRASPEAADPEVANALSSIKRLTETVGASLRKAAFALWKSIENLAISVFQYGNMVARKTAENVADDLASATSKVIVATLMASALAGIAYLTPISASLPGGSWLTKAAEIVKNQVEQLGKGD